MTERPPACPHPQREAQGAVPCPDLPGCAVARTPAAPPHCRAPERGLMAMPRPVLLTDGLGPRTRPGQFPDTKGRPRGRSTRPEEALHDVA